MSWSGLAKILIGFFLAVALLVGAGVATAYYFFTKLSVPPPKPLFANDTAAVKGKPSPATVNKSSASSSPQASPSPTPTPSASPSPQLEPGAYRARVTWSQGLILRDQPSLDANRIGGVAYNQPLVVLKESDDKRWQQVRSEDGSQQGWIKSGNIERVNDNQI